MLPWYRRAANRRYLSERARERGVMRLAAAAGVSYEEAARARACGRRYCPKHKQWRSAENCCLCLRERRALRKLQRHSSRCAKGSSE